MRARLTEERIGVRQALREGRSRCGDGVYYYGLAACTLQPLDDCAPDANLWQAGQPTPKRPPTRPRGTDTASGGAVPCGLTGVVVVVGVGVGVGGLAACWTAAGCDCDCDGEVGVQLRSQCFFWHTKAHVLASFAGGAGWKAVGLCQAWAFDVAATATARLLQL
jgi:hypothetical protein